MGLLASLPAPILIGVVTAVVSSLVTFFVARQQVRSAAARDAHKRQADVSLEISKLLLDPDKAHAASRRFSVAVVKIKSGPGNDKKGLVLFIPLNSRVTLGRDDDNDVVLNRPEISRYHCGLVSDGLSVFIEDYCSTNGVTVNGERMRGGSSTMLRNGDEIGIIGYTLHFQAVHQSTVLSR